MFQPVVPQYRVPLFNALAELPDIQLQIQASPKVPDAPNSVVGLPQWIDISHNCRSLLGGRLFWQCSLSIPADFGPGDVLVFNGSPRFVSTVPQFISASRRGVGTVWWGHGWSSTSVEWRARIRYALMRQATVTLLYTDAEVEDLRSRGPWAEPLVGLNNSMDMTPMREAARAWNSDRLEAFRRSSRIEGDRLLLFCGRLRSIPPTELDVAIRALVRLRERDKRWRLVVIGTGDEERRLRELARQLGLEGSLIWAGAQYEENALAPWFLSAECMVFPGAIGLGLLHAFSYGLPVVTHSDRKSHGPEIGALRHGTNGLLFERGNPESLAEVIETYSADPANRIRMSEAALSTALVDFSFAGMVERFANAIRLASKISAQKLRGKPK
jgi:glycosyltransferase involved in cell wall biosynthesis